LSQRVNESLKNFYVFLCMAITLPVNFEDSNRVSRKRLDIHFHCANWLREIIGTYCHWTPEDKAELVGIVKQRVKQLVKVEKRMVVMLQRTSDSYYPPPATFLDIDTKKKSFESMRKGNKPPAKKAKKVAAVDSDEDVNIDGINKFLREIDSQVIVLMMEDFKYTSDDIGDELGLEELHFLLNDVFHKISALCSSRGVSGFYNPIKVICEINETVLPALVDIFDKVRGELIEMHGSDTNLLYSKDANILKNCFSLILQLSTVIFDCKKLKLAKNQEVLIETLKTLIPGESTKLAGNDVRQLASIVIEKCVSFEGNVRRIDCALSLVKFLHTIAKLSGSDLHYDLVWKTVENFLKIQWKDSKGNDDEGAVFNSSIEKLLEIYVEAASLPTMVKLVDQMSEDFKGIASKSTARQSSFPSFTKSNSIVMMRVYMTRMSQIIGNSHATDFEFWKQCTLVFGMFEDVTKAMDTAAAYLIFLKHFLVYMQRFNSQGIGALKVVAKNKEKFVSMVRNVQKLLRFSHGLSCDLKVREGNFCQFLFSSRFSLLFHSTARTNRSCR
jgi:hypothetical protein